MRLVLCRPVDDRRILTPASLPESFQSGRPDLQRTPLRTSQRFGRQETPVAGTDRRCAADSAMHGCDSDPALFVCVDLQNPGHADNRERVSFDLFPETRQALRILSAVRSAVFH